jgi:uncharacterized membrane protein
MTGASPEFRRSKSGMDDFRRFFVRGLGALVPTLLTFAILVWAYNLVNGYVGVHIERALLAFCTWVSPEPRPGLLNEERDAIDYGTPIDEWNELGERLTVEYKVICHQALNHPDPLVRRRAETARSVALWKILFAKYRLHLLGFLIAIVLVYFLGFFLASFIGRTSWRVVEGILYRIPLIRGVYPHVKQVTDFLLTDRQLEFSGVVAIQYPRPGMWSIGLRIGKAFSLLREKIADDLIIVFVPSSPTPFTGYVVQAVERDVIDLDISIDEAVRFLISGGVIQPGALPLNQTGAKDASRRPVLRGDGSPTV